MDFFNGKIWVENNLFFINIQQRLTQTFWIDIIDNVVSEGLKPIEFEFPTTINFQNNF